CARRHAVEQEARRDTHIPHVADFGDQTWPRDPMMAVKASFPELRAVLLELAWRLVATSPCKSKARRLA
ncbi:MAG: hypothetical protein ACKPKO_42640, partial [Candidatus Fonsibacter sp.]